MQVVGDDARAGGEGCLHPGLGAEAACAGVASEQPRGHQHGGIGGIRAAGDGRDQDRAVLDFEVLAGDGGRGVARGLRILLRPLLGHFLHAAFVDFLCAAQWYAVLRPLRPRERGLDRREVECDHIGIIGGRRAINAPQSLRLGIGLDQGDLVRRPPGEFQIADGFLVDGEDRAGRAELRRHIGDRGAVGQGQSLQAVAEEFHEFIHDALLAQGLGDRQHQVGGRGACGQAARQLETDHLGNEHGHGLAEHGGFGLDAAHAPAEHTQAVDHRGVRIGPHQGVGIGEFAAVAPATGAVRENHARQMLDVDLMDDAGVGRHHFEVAERRLAPAQEHVAFAVSAELDFIVVLERIGRAVLVHLHRVIDDQFGGRQRIDPLWIAAEPDDGFAHGGQIDDAGNAGEVLHDDSRRSECDFVAGLRLRVPFQQGVDVASGDVHAVLEAQKIFEQNFQGKGQASDILRLEGGEAQDFVLLRAHFQRRSCLEAIRHDPSTEKREL